MVSQCKLLINCTGPYRLLGEGVLSACVKRIVCFLDLLKIHVRLYSTISLKTTVTRFVTKHMIEHCLNTVWIDLNGSKPFWLSDSFIFISRAERTQTMSVDRSNTDCIKLKASFKWNRLYWYLWWTSFYWGLYRTINFYQNSIFIFCNIQHLFLGNGVKIFWRSS